MSEEVSKSDSIKNDDHHSQHSLTLTAKDISQILKDFLSLSPSSNRRNSTSVQKRTENDQSFLAENAHSIVPVKILAKQELLDTTPKSRSQNPKFPIPVGKAQTDLTQNPSEISVDVPYGSTAFTDGASCEDDEAFNWPVFFKECIYNTFQFYILPIILLVEGKKSARNRGYLPGNAFFYASFILQAMLTIVLCLYFIHQDKMIHVSVFEIIVCIVFTFVRVGVIAIKYAFYGKTDNKALDETQHTEEIAQKLVLLGWSMLPDDVIASETSKTQRLLGIYFENLKFNAQSSENQEKNLKSIDLYKILWKKSREKLSKFRKCLEMFGAVGSFIVAFYPMLARAYFKEPPFGSNSYEITVIIFIFIQNWFMFRNNFLFICIAAVDLKRRFIVLAHWTRILNQQEVTYTNNMYLLNREMVLNNQYKTHYLKINSEVQMYTINFHDSEQIHNWWEMFLLIKYFGKGYYNRLMGYCGWSFFIFAILSLASMAMMATNMGLISFLPTTNLSNVSMAFGNCVVVACFVILLKIFYAISLGKKINELWHLQEKMLEKRRSELIYLEHHVIKNNLENDSNINLQKVVVAQKMIQTILNLMKSENEDNPIRIVGLKTDANLLRFAASALSGLLAIITRLTMAN